MDLATAVTSVVCGFACARWRHASKYERVSDTAHRGPPQKHRSVAQAILYIIKKDNPAAFYVPMVGRVGKDGSERANRTPSIESDPVILNAIPHDVNRLSRILKSSPVQDEPLHPWFRSADFRLLDR